MFTRFNGNVVPFADDATSTNRTVFGGVTQSDAIDDNLNADFKKGWEIVGLNDNPTREDFNAMGYTLGALISYLYEMGISEWNDKQEYRQYSRAIGSDGIVYKAKTGTDISPNVGNNPTADATNWEIDNQFNINSFINKNTPTDTDNLAIQEVEGLFKKLSWANLKATLKTYFDTLYRIASSETVSGIVELATTAEAQKGSDDTRVITPLKLKNSVLGLGQTWQDVTASRTLGVIYTNNTGRSIFASFNCSSSDSAAPQGISITVDGIGVTNCNSTFSNGSLYQGYRQSLTAIIPNGAIYSYTSTVAPTSYTVNELR